MPIIEGQAIGRPILTSNILPMTEIASNAACFVDPLSITSIRHGFIKLISNEQYRNQCVLEGLENVTRFNIKKISDQYKQLY